jgi:hypothetical protein
MEENTVTTTPTPIMDDHAILLPLLFAAASWPKFLSYSHSKHLPSLTPLTPEIKVKFSFTGLKNG